MLQGRGRGGRLIEAVALSLRVASFESEVDMLTRQTFRFVQTEFFLFHAINTIHQLHSGTSKMRGFHAVIGISRKRRAASEEDEFFSKIQVKHFEDRER